MNTELPRLSDDQFQPFLKSHPGLTNLLYFQIGMNILLVAAALALNVMFYAKHRAFPKLMVAYAAATVLFVAVTISAINSAFPDANLSRSYITLLRYLLWAGALIPYLLTSNDIKQRFVK